MVSKRDILPLLSDRPQAFAGQRPPHLPEASSRPASILMLFAEGVQGLEILLTKRAGHLRLHAGQVSFPGGKPEEMDNSPADTALRETEEETGLSADMVAIKGYLPPVLTSTNFVVDLTVGFCRHPAEEIHPLLRPAPEEVDVVWFEPANPLVQLGQFEQRALVRDGQTRHYWQIKNSQPVIWGATAAMLRQLAILLEQK